MDISINGILGTLRDLVAVTKDLEWRQRLIDLQSGILDLQGRLQDLQAQVHAAKKSQFEAEDRCRALIEEKKQRDDHEQLGRDFPLLDLGSGQIVRFGRDSRCPTEPPHPICAHCFRKGQHRILQRSPALGVPQAICGECNTAITVLSKPDNPLARMYYSKP